MQAAVEEEVEVDNFLDSLKSARTKELYAHHRKQFLNFLQRKSINQDNAADATQQIIRYLKKLKNDGLSYSHRKIALSAIKHDYVMSDRLLLNWKKIAMFLGENESKYEIRGYTHDEIRRILDVADIKYRAVILMLASTGMRRDALVHIDQSKDMEYLKDYKLYKIKIYKKSKFEQICFTTPEAAEAITTYRNTRPGAKYFHNVTNKSVSMALIDLAAKAGLIQKGGSLGFGTEHRNEIPAVHGLRKFCITQMARAKVDTEIAKLLTGHSIGVRGRYLNYTDDDLLQEYMKAVDLLTINEANRLRRKVDVLQDKDQEVRYLREQLKSTQSGLEEWRERLNEMESQTQSLLDMLAKGHRVIKNRAGYFVLAEGEEIDQIDKRLEKKFAKKKSPKLQLLGGLMAQNANPVIDATREQLPNRDKGFYSNQRSFI